MRHYGSDMQTHRLKAFGNQLIEVHLWLREELARLRENVDAYLDGHGGRPQDLRAHCLTFCSALTRHHTGEDAGAFPALAEEFPDLRPVLEELARDHETVTELMHRLQALLDEPPKDAATVRSELDGLAALLESHFVYEEKRIVSALNSLTRSDWDTTPAFLQTGQTGAPA